MGRGLHVTASGALKRFLKVILQHICRRLLSSWDYHYIEFE